MTAGSLVIHQQTQHGVESGVRKQWETPPPDGETHTYRMDFLSMVGPWEFPVEGCRRRAVKRTAMGVYFMHRHFRDTVIILGEGNLPHTWCP